VPRQRRREVVADASAILAVLFDEDGGDVAAPRLARAVVCSVNAAEVEAKLLDHGVPATDHDEIWRDLEVAIAPFDRATARIAAGILHRHRRKGMSLGDAACLATAAQLDLPAMTADRMWSEIDDAAITVEVIRR
jgi:ribonuclease VapC